ncbi:hypothetical protein AB0D59_23755 [Streptomyces sp. NPDC048417]|uniref:hypothetical protein n=1 Tax=Streptomyces sp. NPDC048417 TaxID=3155387 RepID=UPI003431F40C
MTSSPPYAYAYGTPPVAERADRVVVARHRPEARATVNGRVIVEDRMTGSLEKRSRA